MPETQVNPPKKPLSWPWMIIGIVFIASVALAVVLLPEYLFRHFTLDAESLKHLNPGQRATAVAATRQSVALAAASLLAALAAGAGVLVSRHTVHASRMEQHRADLRHAADIKNSEKQQADVAVRHREDLVETRRRNEYDQQRMRLAHLAERYQDGAKLLGDDKPAVRLAGVFSISRLADEWPEQRQTCVSILCSYLRMNTTGSGEELVRRAILEQIEEHGATSAPADISWSSSRIDLDGVVFPPFSFAKCRFANLSIEGAVVEEKLVLDDVEITDSLDARRLEVRGLVLMRTSGAGTVNLGDAVVTGGHLTVEHRKTGEVTHARRHTVLTSGVEISHSGEYHLVASPFFARDDVRADDIRVIDGVFYITQESGVPIRSKSVNARRVLQTAQGRLQIDKSIHKAVVGRAPTVATDECPHIGRAICDDPECSFVFCRCI